MAERTAVEAMAEALASWYTREDDPFLSDPDDVSGVIDLLHARGYRLVPEDEKIARDRIRELLWLGDFNWPGRPPDVHSLLKFYLAMLDAAPGAPKKEEAS